MVDEIGGGEALAFCKRCGAPVPVCPFGDLHWYAFWCSSCGSLGLDRFTEWRHAPPISRDARQRDEAAAASETRPEDSGAPTPLETD